MFFGGQRVKSNFNMQNLGDKSSFLLFAFLKFKKILEKVSSALIGEQIDPKRHAEEFKAATESEQFTNTLNQHVD